MVVAVDPLLQTYKRMNSIRHVPAQHHHINPVPPSDQLVQDNVIPTHEEMGGVCDDLALQLVQSGHFQIEPSLVGLSSGLVLEGVLMRLHFRYGFVIGAHILGKC